MNFGNSPEKVKRVMPSRSRASSMFTSSADAIATAKLIPLNTHTSKSILRELYEGLREYCEGIGYIHGLKFRNHESIGLFIKDFLEESALSGKFDRYRKLRNGINYLGNDVDMETVKWALLEIPQMITGLKKHTIEGFK